MVEMCYNLSLACIYPKHSGWYKIKKDTHFRQEGIANQDSCSSMPSWEEPQSMEQYCEKISSMPVTLAESFVEVSGCQPMQSVTYLI